MPKDNEVDETQHWGDLMRELRSKVPEGLAPLVDRLSFACDQRLSFLLHERYEQDLSHAATVAELRAEVESSKLQGELAALEQFLRMASEPVGQECCGQGRYECCGNPIPVFAQPNEVFLAMSDRHAEILTSLAALTGADPT